MTKSSTPFISPDVTAKGVLELQTKFPKVRDYDAFWDDIRRNLETQGGPSARIMEYGTVHHDGVEYVLRSLEMGEDGAPHSILFSGHHYEESGLEALNRGLESGYFAEMAKTQRLSLIPAAFPRAFNHILRYVDGKDAKGQAVIVDTNRDLFTDPALAQTEEGKYLAEYILRQERVQCFIDSHETPKRDICFDHEDIPEPLLTVDDIRGWRKFAADFLGRKLGPEDLTIPQGAFVITQIRDSIDALKNQLDFCKAVIDGIGEHSPIAPENKLLGKTNIEGVTVGEDLAGSTRSFMTQLGVPRVVVTELNPDMDGMDADKAADAQLSGIKAALSFEA